MFSRIFLLSQSAPSAFRSHNSQTVHPHEQLLTFSISKSSSQCIFVCVCVSVHTNLRPSTCISPSTVFPCSALSLFLSLSLYLSLTHTLFLPVSVSCALSFCSSTLFTVHFPRQPKFGALYQSLWVSLGRRNQSPLRLLENSTRQPDWESLV